MEASCRASCRLRLKGCFYGDCGRADHSSHFRRQCCCQASEAGSTSRGARNSKNHLFRHPAYYCTDRKRSILCDLASTEKISESIKEDVPEQEYTIWSSSDIAEADEQIPLVKIKVEADGTLTPTAISDNPFDQESYKIAINSLKTTEGRPLKDRLLRVDKSLNHSDPNFSTELTRNMIKANKGEEKKSIEERCLPFCSWLVFSLWFLLWNRFKIRYRQKQKANRVFPLPGIRLPNIRF